MKTIETTQNILSSFQAMRNCEKSGNSAWFARHQEQIENTLLESLPHGSGIDCEWEFDFCVNYISCKNSWHILNDNGYYNGFIDFELRIKTGYRNIDKSIDFRIIGKFGECQDIKDYLYETIDYALSAK